MTISMTKMTAQQFLMMGEDPPGVRLELVDGEILVSPSPAYEHSYVDTQLRLILGIHIRQFALGELVGDVDTIFGAMNVRRPDIIFTAASRVPLLRGQRHGIHIPPDLCVEIVSPGSATMDRDDKFTLYATYGVAHYWLVDPEPRTFVAYRLVESRFVQSAIGSGNEKVTAAPFPRLEISLGELWLPAIAG